MPHDEFDQSSTFKAALEVFSLALNRTLVALRDEVVFTEEVDHETITAAALFSSMLEDAHKEADGLCERLERKG
jgi:hypothetical protein